MVNSGNRTHRTHQESSGVIGIHRESSGVIRSHRSHQESSGVIRSHRDSSGFIRSHRDSSGVIRSHQESSGVIRSHQESSGVIRSHQESSGVTSCGSNAKRAWLRPVSHLTSSYLMRKVINMSSEAIRAHQVLLVHDEGGNQRSSEAHPPQSTTIRRNQPPSGAIRRTQAHSGALSTRVTTGGPDAEFRQTAVGRRLRVEAQWRDGEDAT